MEGPSGVNVRVFSQVRSHDRVVRLSLVLTNEPTFASTSVRLAGGMFAIPSSMHDPGFFLSAFKYLATVQDDEATYTRLVSQRRVELIQLFEKNRGEVDPG